MSENTSSSVSSMRHYELVLLVHPDQSEQVPGMIERYSAVVTNKGGVVQVEDWGRRHYPFQYSKYLSTLHTYEHSVRPSEIEELEHSFRFNDAVIRHLCIRNNLSPTGPSPMMMTLQKETDKQSDSETANN